MVEVDFSKIEKKWQGRWEKEKVFEAGANPKKKKYYISMVYPYANGLLHLGHLYTYVFSEVMLRFRRMQGYNVHMKVGYHCTGTPIVAAAKRVEEKEEGQLQILKEMGIGKKDISKFKDPEYWIEYWPKEMDKDLKRLGFSHDVRYTFKTTSFNPAYDSMIKWQFNKLKEKDLVKKGKHPVVWCPKDNMPVGDHARIEGEGETPQEFLLFKHKLDDGRFLITATLRQDTVLGITNLFINPDADYVEAEVNGERWVLGVAALKGLGEQDFEVGKGKKVKGKEFIGKKVKEYDGSEVLVLPASFLDPKFGTGLVHSVPSDSADDLIALRDLQNDEKLMKKYSLDINEIRKIKPIPVLDTPGYGDVPAQAMIDKYKVESQDQRGKLEEIKKELYKLSHYTATLNKKYKKGFSKNLEGKKVEEAKEIIKEDLIGAGFAAVYYELSGNVVCRCLTPSIVKIVSDQWFIEYNYEKWKGKAHACLDKMKIFPEQTRKQLDYVIDWLNRWACVREFGLGTRLPWDDKWVIESLSDSTIQMAYATISKYLQNSKDYGFNLEGLNDEFFDFVFLGKGKVKDVEESTGIPKKMIETMRGDFDYWYPFDFRNSAKDLIQNHLAFCIFNHVAIFPEKYWPRAYSLNGRIMVDNEKMSKSKGNFYTARELYEKYGSDVVRLTSSNAGEGIDDANYEMAFLDSAKKKLNELLTFAKENYNKGRKDKNRIDSWFESVMNRLVRDTTQHMENVRFKSALKEGFFDMNRYLKIYLNGTGNNPNKEIINYFIESQVKILSPFCPHIAEEIWEVIGKKSFVSLEKWPQTNEKKIDEKLEREYESVEKTTSDIFNIIRIVKNKENREPSKVYLYVIPKEIEMYNAEFLSNKTNKEVFVFANNDKDKYDPQEKSNKARPGKPAIYLE